MCEELGLYQSGKPLIGTEKPSAMEKPELRVSPADFSNVSRPLLTNQPAKGNLLRDHKERVENLSHHDQLIKIMQRCWIHRYCSCWAVFFVTEDVEEFANFDGHVACREQLYLEMTSHQSQKVAFVGIQRLVLSWKLQSVTIKENTELRSESNSLSKDGSRSWTRISDELNRFVRDLTEKVRVCENEQNTSTGTEKPVAKSRPKQVSAPSSSSTSTTIPIHLRKWIDVEPGTQNSQSYEVAKKRNTSLRHEPLPSEADGAVEFRRLKLEFASNFSTSPNWSIRSWKSHLVRSGGHKKRFQYSVNPHVDAILYLRTIQDHSGGNPIDPSLQDNVMIPNDFLKYIYHVENFTTCTPLSIQD